jgi:hypothetical protein
VPDKRQTSKQRRAARNRASRQALAARRDNAVAAPSPSSRSSRSSASAGTGASRGSGRGWWRAGATAGGSTNGAATAGAPPEPPPSGIMGMLQSRRPGDRAVLTAFVLAVVAAIYLLFYQVPADDRGEPLPASFRGVAIAAREQLTGAEVGDNKISLLDASGPQIFVVIALPIFVTLFALWANRRPDRSRLLTFAMLGMAAAVILTGGIGIFFFPALIALAIGGFRVRKADLPARAAERATGGTRAARGRGGVIDADSTEVTDEAPDDADDRVEPRSLRSLWSRRPTMGGGGAAAGRAEDAAADDADDGAAGDDPGGAGADAPAEGDEVEFDPLAELEAELEAERDGEGSRGEDESR